MSSDLGSVSYFGAAKRAAQVGALAAVRARVRSDLVRMEAISFYDDVVRSCYGDPQDLLGSSGLDSSLLQDPDAQFPYPVMVSLLERAAQTLERPDFGLRLAMRQHPVGIMGPLDIVMRNSPTLGHAFRYNREHAHAYCAGTILEPFHDGHGRWILRFQILFDRITEHAQASEHALFITYLAIKAMSQNKANIRELWFTHRPLQEISAYREYFDAPLRFEQPFDALVLDGADDQLPIDGRSNKLYSIAARLLDLNYPQPEALLQAKVKSLVGEKLAGGGQLYKEVAAALAMHPRTLQRRLRCEGTSFDDIKDEVRRENAWRYLTQTRLPLTRISALLGYSEHSAFSRSCTRWFSRSPREMRNCELVAARQDV